MKKIIVLIFCALTMSVFSQRKVEKLKEYTASNGVTYKIGDKITLNKGSNFNGSFNYVQIGGWGMSMNAEANKLPSTNNGLIVTVKKIKKIKRNVFKGVVFTVDGGNISNYLLIIEDAIKSCEITPCDKTTKVVVKESKYDKLKKLKELLDTNVLTQEEFESEKKKILSEK